ncbi:MAG: hypothetical protein LBD20_01340, partial [Spirochaetaceae bacterium]|nr:hypothetical protein [Spirochaetaceae bacterium]
MHKIVTFKSICIRIFFSLLIAAAALYGLIIYQKPAFYYDVLIASRPAKQPSPNLLLIDTGSVEGGGIIDSALALSVVDTLIELEADTLIIQTPVLGVASGGKISESDLSAGFDEEFGLVTSNIRNLFTGITMGLIEPADIESYIDETVRLTEAGKARLLQSAFKGDEELLDNIEKSQAAFGRVFAAPELLMQLIRAGGTEAAAVRASLTTYSRAEPDSDGLVRRVRPVIQTENGPIEHITFTALKSRFSSVEFVETRFNAALSLQPASAKTRPAPPPAADGGDAANGGAAADGGDAVGGGDAANGGAAAGGVDAAGDEGAAGGGIAAGGESVADGGDAADGGVAAGGEGAAGGGSAAGGVDAAGGEGAIDERILIPLDRDGAIRFDHPADTHDFKYIPINLLIDYAEGDKTLYKLLAEGVSLSRYSRIEPERYPPFIYEKNTGIYRQLLDAPDDTVKALWRDGRAAYFAACAAFFSAETEQAIHNSFAGLLEDENLGEEGRDKVLAMRDKEFEKFNIARDYYNSV